MILVSKKEKPFAYSMKGTPRRKVVITDYDAEIEELYRTVEDTAIKGFNSPAIWSLEASKVYVRAVVLGVMMTMLGDDDDLFAYGCDRFDRYPSFALPFALNRMFTASRQPGSGKSSSTASARAPRSTPGPSRSRSYTRIPLSMRWESSLPIWCHQKRWRKPSAPRWNKCSL